VLYSTFYGIAKAALVRLFPLAKPQCGNRVWYWLSMQLGFSHLESK